MKLYMGENQHLNLNEVNKENKTTMLLLIVY